MNRKTEPDAGGRIVFAIVILVTTVVIFLAMSNRSEAAGFREQQGWQFDDPVTKAVKIQQEHMRLLKVGKFYEGSHANKTIYIGQVLIEDVNGNMQYSHQSNTNIGNYTTVNQQGGGELIFNGAQDSGRQDNDNQSAQSGNQYAKEGDQAVTTDFIFNGTGS